MKTKVFLIRVVFSHRVIKLSVESAATAQQVAREFYRSFPGRESIRVHEVACKQHTPPLLRAV